MDPKDQRAIAVDLARDAGVVAALDTMSQAAVIFAGEQVPDIEHAREALTAWGIPFEKGEPIRRMFGSTPALKVALPRGWKFTHRGGGGHVELLDDRGAARLRWHIHGWDPISLSVNRRFDTREIDLSESEGVVQILDGETVIHTIPIRYPHARLRDPNDDRPFYRNGWDDDGWTRDMGRANYAARDAAREAATAWLDANRPGHRDYIKSWVR